MFNDFLFKKKIKFSFLLLIHPTSAASVKIREMTYKARILSAPVGFTPPPEIDQMLDAVKWKYRERRTHHSKSASVHGQESDIWELYWSLALTHRTFAFSFWKILFIPMMHASPCDE